MELSEWHACCCGPLLGTLWVTPGSRWLPGALLPGACRRAGRRGVYALDAYCAAIAVATTDQSLPQLPPKPDVDLQCLRPAMSVGQHPAPTRRKRRGIFIR